MAVIQSELAGKAKIAAKVFLPVMILAVISLSVTAHARNMIWRDEVTLWEDIVRKSPYKARPHNYLGEAYQQQGRLDDAVAEYRTAIRLKPDLVFTPLQLGVAYRTQGHLDDAIREYQAAIKLESSYR